MEQDLGSCEASNEDLLCRSRICEPASLEVLEDRTFLLAEQLVVIGSHELREGIGLFRRSWELRSLECFESALPEFLRPIKDACDGFPEDDEEAELKDDDGCGPCECVDQGKLLGAGDAARCRLPDRA